MDFIVSAETDIGTTKQTNQDSYHVRVWRTNAGKTVFSVICDGMGGYDCGEIASAHVVRAFMRWADQHLPAVLGSDLPDRLLRRDWSAIIDDCNLAIARYASDRRLVMGTTLTAMLMTGQRYFIVNVGDTRAYELDGQLLQLTRDQTLVADQVRRGLLTREEARMSPQRNVLLQCIGASEAVVPEFFFGTPKKNAVYMMCSDGFRNELSDGEIFSSLRPERLISREAGHENARALIDVLKQRRERDNITVITIKTCG